MTRRSFLWKSAAGCVVAEFWAARRAAGQDAKAWFKSTELNAMEAAAHAFMKKHHVPGLSVAMAKDDRLVYASGFGWADKDRGESVTTRHLFRIASVSKPITSAAIFRFG